MKNPDSLDAQSISEINPALEADIKRKVHIATVGWVSSILSGLVIYFSLMGLSQLLIFQKQIQNFEADFSTLDATSGIDKILGLFYGVLAGVIGFAILFLVCSIGLIRRRHWARKVFVGSSWLFLLIGLLCVAAYIFYAEELLPNLVKGTVPDLILERFGQPLVYLYHIRLVSLGILIILTMRALFRIARKFVSTEYVRLFR